MGDLTRLSDENSKRILDIVEALQPVTAQRVQEELERRHGLRAPLDQVTRYMEFLRSNFPRKLAHAGPELWILVDLG
jgi:hypothetical protein